MYLAGPMSGLPEYNFPAFHEAAAQLRGKHGLKVGSPAEWETPSDNDPFDLCQIGDPGWVKNLKRDLAWIMTNAEGIVVLPGWEKSIGALLETYVGACFGLPILRYPDLEVLDRFSPEVRRAETKKRNELRAIEGSALNGQVKRFVKGMKAAA